VHEGEGSGVPGEQVLEDLAEPGAGGDVVGPAAQGVLGHGAGAEPTELLAAAVGSCLASSLLYCARKARIEPLGIRAEVRVTPERREGRVRIGRIEVHLVPRILESDRARFGVCLERFESYCTVAESVRRGIPIQVLVEPLTAPVPLEAHEPSAA